MDDPSPRHISYAVLAVAGLLATLVAAWFVRDATTEDLSFNNPPLTATAPIGGPRGDTPAMCVQTVNVDKSVQAEAKKKIDEVLLEISELQYLSLVGDNMPGSVDTGCPVGPAAYDDSACQPAPSGLVLADFCTRMVDELGRYWRLIYILPKSEIERLTPPRYSRITKEEKVCSGDVCLELSWGLLLSPAEIRDEATLRYWLYGESGLNCYLPEELYSLPEFASVHKRCLEECDETLLSRLHMCRRDIAAEGPVP